MPAKYRRKSTRKTYKRKSIRKTTYKKRYRRTTTPSRTTLKTVCEMSKPIEWFASYGHGTPSQTRNVIGLNNVIDGISQGTDGHHQYFDITQTPRYQEYKDRFRKIIIHGVKITFNAYQTTKDREWREQNYATYEQAYPSPQLPFHVSETSSDKYNRDNMRQRPDFYQGKALQNFSKYFPVAKVLSKRRIDPAVLINRNEGAGGQGKYWHGFFTNTIYPSDDTQDGHDMGRMHLKWYVTFLDPKNPAIDH